MEGQRIPFREWSRLAAICCGIGLVFLIWAVAARDKAPLGLATLFLGFGGLLCIPAVQSYKDRDADGDG